MVATGLLRHSPQTHPAKTKFSFNTPMINSFGLRCPAKILFGSNELEKLANEALRYGKNPLLVTGARASQEGGVLASLKEKLSEKFFSLTTVTIDSEPTPMVIDRIVGELPRNIDLVISIGGGSVLDGGKAIAAMSKEQGSVVNYLEGVGDRKPSGAKLPFIAVPTTAGTGSEATANAVLCNVGKQGFKKSLRHDNYIPDLALVDPQLAQSCPPALSLSCGMDCFTQLVEGYLSTKSSQVTDLLAVDGIKAVARSLKLLATEKPPLGAREDMAYATLLSGVVLTNAGLGTIHGFASAIGGLFNIPHGLVCGTLMAASNRMTLTKLRQNPDEPAHQTALKKYAQLGKIFSGVETKSDDWYQESFLAELDELTGMLAKPRLGEYGIAEDDFAAIIKDTGNKNNPVKLEKEELREILTARL